MENEKLWFKAKNYGWGWTPITWQGWLIILFWIIINVFSFVNTDITAHSGSDTLIIFSPVFIISTIVLIFICYKKGEKPRWRWGEDKK